MKQGHLRQLFIYPVKSLAGIALERAEVTDRGFAGDREWMIVDENGTYVTQRQLPQMAAIQVMLEHGGVSLSHPRAGILTVAAPAPDAPMHQVRVWKDTCDAQMAGPDVREWLAEALAESRPLSMAKFAPGFTRAPQPSRFGDATTQFADAAPFLIVNQTSLDRLNEHLVNQGIEPVDIRRFRPNLVADGLPAFAEHAMNRLEASLQAPLQAPLKVTENAATWELCDRCQRCSIITVDPDSGTRSPGAVPFKQLAAINPMPDNPKAPAFGINARLLRGAGQTVAVGSRIFWSTT